MILGLIRMIAELNHHGNEVSLKKIVIVAQRFTESPSLMGFEEERKTQMKAVGRKSTTRDSSADAHIKEKPEPAFLSPLQMLLLLTLMFMQLLSEDKRERMKHKNHSLVGAVLRGC